MRTALPLALASCVLTLTGCGLLGDGAGGSGDPEAVAGRLAEALSDRSLGGIALTDPDDAGRFGDLVAPLADHPVKVSAGEVSRDGDAATVPLHWRWRIEGHPWRYDTEAHLVQQQDGWALAWRSAVLEPSLHEHERLSVDRVAAERGDITGAGGVPLVTGRPVLRYGLDKSKLRRGQVPRSATRLAGALDVDAGGFRRAAVAAGPRAFVEAVVLREQDARERVRPGFADIPGALAVPDELPLAPTREFAEPVLGRAGPATAEIVEDSKGRVLPGDVVGLSGLQARYDERLGGDAGTRVRAVPVEECSAWPDCPPAGKPRQLASWPAAPGRPLRLTLDAGLQASAERALAELGGREAPHSALVAIRPSTGAVLAAANGAGNDGLNAATFGQYAPGSTFKVVTALALLRAGMSPTDEVSCPPTIEVDGKTFKNYDDYPADRLGTISLMTAIANSCNTALIGERDRLAKGDLAEAAAALGVGRDHDVGFPAYFGQVPDPGGETEAAADLIGQGRVLAGPLAMATVAASVAAGHAVVPRLVEGRGDAASTGEPDHPLTEEEAGSLRSLLGAVVSQGSGRFLADVPGVTGAKTGTAEYGEPAADGSLPTHAWMIATRDDLAVAVFVQTGASGSQTAGPVLEDFLR